MIAVIRSHHMVRRGASPSCDYAALSRRSVCALTLQKPMLHQAGSIGHSNELTKLLQLLNRTVGMAPVGGLMRSDLDPG